MCDICGGSSDHLYEAHPSHGSMISTTIGCTDLIVVLQTTCPPAESVRSVITPIHSHIRGPEGAGLVGPSCSMFSVFVGLRGNPRDLKLPAHNTWLFPHWRHDDAVQQYRESIGGDVPFLPLVFVSFSSGRNTTPNYPVKVNINNYMLYAAKDGAWADRHPGKSVVELLTIADFDRYQ